MDSALLNLGWTLDTVLWVPKTRGENWLFWPLIFGENPEIHFRWPATLWAENLETEKVRKTSKAIVGSQSHSESIVLDSVFDSSVYSEILIFRQLFLGKSWA